MRPDTVTDSPVLYTAHNTAHTDANEMLSAPGQALAGAQCKRQHSPLVVPCSADSLVLCQHWLHSLLVCTRQARVHKRARSRADAGLTNALLCTHPHTRMLVSVGWQGPCIAAGLKH